MKTIIGFENEEIEVSDFGEWVGKDYIDYKFEYENNQKVIKELFKGNQKYKEVFDKINVFLDNHDKNAGKLYYKYDNKYLLSEIKEDIRDILKEVK